jgi:hypothetical protein
MPEQTEFYFEPEGGAPTLISIWRPLIYIFIFCLLATLTMGKRYDVALVVTLVFTAGIALVIASGQYHLYITVSLANKTLEYVYMNGLLQEKRRSIFLPTAEGRYRPAQVTKTRRDYRLTLQNEKRPFNRINIIADSKRGFSREQLDHISRLIDECKR